jgi:hypothetical protein
VRVPEDWDAAVVVRLPLGDHLRTLPVPDAALSVAVATDDVTGKGVIGKCNCKESNTKSK